MRRKAPRELSSILVLAYQVYSAYRSAGKLGLVFFCCKSNRINMVCIDWALVVHLSMRLLF